MLLHLPRRARHRLVAAALLTTATLVLSACTGSSSGPDEPDAAPSTSTTPAPTPAEAVVAPLLDLPEIDVATLPLPDPVSGADPQTSASNARSLRALAVASQEVALWKTPPGTEAVAAVAAAAPPQVRDSMTGPETLADGPAISAFWAPSFAADTQPTGATVVDARWADTVSVEAGQPLPTLVIELTTVYTFEETTPVVIQRQFKLGSQRPAPELGAYQWSVDIRMGGYDGCRLWTDGVYEPSDSPDLDELQSVVDHVIDQEPIDVANEDTDVEGKRARACQPAS